MPGAPEGNTALATVWPVAVKDTGGGTVGTFSRALSTGTGVIAVVVAVAGCSGPGGSAMRGIPAASRGEASATRAYLVRDGRGLVQLDELAGVLVRRHTPAVCRAGTADVTRIVRGRSSGAVADPALAELFGDEMSEVSSVLARCRSGSVPAVAVAVAALRSVHGLVDQRLRADKVSR